MANIKFTQLPVLAGANVTPQTIIPVVENGFNWQLEAGNLRGFVNNNPGGNVTANIITGNTFIGAGFFFANGAPVNNYFDANVAAYIPTDPTILAIQGNVSTLQTGLASTNANLVITNNNLANTNANVANTNANVASTNANLVITNNNLANTNANLANTNATIITLSNSIANLQGTTYTNANASAYFASGTANANIITTANISGSYLLGNGRFISGILPTYGNANVAAYLPVYGGNVLVSTVSNTTSNLNLVAGGNVVLTSGVGNGVFLNSYVETTGAVAFSTSYTPAISNGTVQTFTATNNFTLNAPTGMRAGQNICLIITQDATGNRVMTPNSAYKFAGSTKLSTLPNSLDLMTIFYSGTAYMCTIVKGYI